MEWTLRTKERKQYDAVMSKGVWKKKFAILPCKVEENSGLRRYVWLKFVMKKCKISYRNEEFKFTPMYKMPEQLTQDILADKKGVDQLNFERYSDGTAFKNIAETLNIKDDK